MKEEKIQNRVFLIAGMMFLILFPLYVGITIYKEEPAKCHKTDTCNSIFR